MKKCASCTKDLPDAALHCVFCGAKQPPAPAVQQGMAKTAFGNPANDMQEQLRQSAAQQGRGGAPGQPAPGFPPSAFAPARPATPPSHQPLGLQATMMPNQPAAPPSHQPLGLQATMMPNQPASPTAHQPLGLQPTMMPNQPPGPPRSHQPMAMAATQAVQAYPGPGPSQGGPGPGHSLGGPGPGPQGPSAGQGPTIIPHAQAPSAGQGPTMIPHGQAPMAPRPMAQAGFVPASAASAKTMFAPGPAPQGSFGPAAGPTMSPTIVPQSMQPMAMPPRQMHPPTGPQPPMVPAMPQPVAMPQPMPQPMAIPAAMPQPYHASQSFAQARRPIDPWRDSLRAMMFIWGVLLLGAFATPLTTSPLSFSWDVILNGQGTARLPPLMLAAIGLLSVIVAVIPMATVPRGMIAALFGLAGILVPIVLDGMPPWQATLTLVGTLVLITGLLIRSEYRGSLLPRVLVTLGALALLVQAVLPEQGTIPLVSLFKAVIDAPGSAKVAPALGLGFVTVVVLSLLFTWMPAPISGGARLWAWIVILWGLVLHVTVLLLGGQLGDAISGTPHAALVPWIYGGAGAGLTLGAAYQVLFGYGLAATLSKQLE